MARHLLCEPHRKVAPLEGTHRLLCSITTDGFGSIGKLPIDGGVSLPDNIPLANDAVQLFKYMAGWPRIIRFARSASAAGDGQVAVERGVVHLLLDLLVYPLGGIRAIQRRFLANIQHHFFLMRFFRL